MPMSEKWPVMDKDLEERIDQLSAALPVSRKKMFGTSSWFLDSNSQMMAGVWGDGVMVRVGQDDAGALIESGDAEPFDPMGGRPMREYVFLNADRIAEDADLIDWLERAAAFASSLAPKKKKKRSKK